MVSFAALEHFGAGTTVHSVDISASSLEIARDKAVSKGVDVDKAKFFQGSVVELGTLQIEKGQYSLITCCSALVLLPGKLETTLRKWGAYLKPDGVLIFDLPAKDTQVITYSLSKAIAPYRVPTVAREWIASEDSVKQLIIESGMAVHDVFVTRVYKTTQMQLYEAQAYWDRAVAGPIYDISGLGPEERECAKQAFLGMMNERAENGVVRDEFGFYVGVERKE
jgi:SAM-dependent methyltransferase